MQNENIFYNDNKNLKIEISDEGFEAYLTIYKTGNPISENEIRDLLDKVGIKEGFIRAANYLKMKSFKKKFNEPFLIALGKKNHPKLEIQFHHNRKTWFKESFTLKQLSEFPAIDKDEAIATLSAKGKVSQSVDVFGKPHQAEIKNNHEIIQLLGDHVYWNQQTFQICAAISGYPYLNEKNKISIRTEISIEEDIIDKKIECLAAIECNGKIKNSQVIGNKNIIINQPVEGSNIYSEETIKVGSANNCTFVCAKDFKFTGVLLNCKVFSQQHVFGSGSSEICSGLIQAGDSIIAAKAGTENSKLTEVEITYSPVYKFLLTSYYRDIYPNFINAIENFLKITDLQESYKNDVFRDLFNKQKKVTIKLFKAVFPNTYLRVLSQSYSCKQFQDSISL